MSRGAKGTRTTNFSVRPAIEILVPGPQADCHESVTSLQNSCRRAQHLPRLRPPAKLLVTPDSKNCVKRFTPFLHYPNKWKTSLLSGDEPRFRTPTWRSPAGIQRVPEPTGKRLRRFVRRLLQRFVSAVFFSKGADRFVCPNLEEFHSSRVCRPLHPADRTPFEQPRGSETPGPARVTHPRSRKQPLFASPSATLSATSSSPGQVLGI